MLRLYRRHRVSCKQTSETYRRCACPIYVEGSLAGEHVRKALDLTSWEAASKLITAWNASGEIAGVEVPTIADAVSKFLDDARARNLHWETIRKYDSVLKLRLLAWCASEGHTQLKHLDVTRLREFRATWSDGPCYATKNLERLRAFFRFCQQAGWTKTNPATAVKPPKQTAKPTLPFTREEMTRILAACDRYRGDQGRIRAFILVMRYSGLRIGDTIALRRDQVNEHRIALYTQKTGQHVYVPVPAPVIDALGSFEPIGDRFFWSGSNMRSAVGNWSRYLASVFKLADVEGGHSHRFRDTFAVELLLAGVPIEDVSILLGHSSVRITEKHYAPWVRARQIRLEERVRMALAS